MTNVNRLCANLKADHSKCLPSNKLLCHNISDITCFCEECASGGRRCRYWGFMQLVYCPDCQMPIYTAYRGGEFELTREEMKIILAEKAVMLRDQENALKAAKKLFRAAEARLAKAIAEEVYSDV